MLLEDVKRSGELLTGIGRPTIRQVRLHLSNRKASAFHFRDDGLVPNHPRWPVIFYRGVVSLKGALDPAASFEVLFSAHGWKDSWRDIVYDWLHYHSVQHEVLGFARGHAVLRVGGPRGRTLRLKAGDVLILPAGTGHQRLSMSDDLLVVGAYPHKGGYDMCHARKVDHDRSALAVSKVPKPEADPVYGVDGPLNRLWQ